MKQYVIDGLRPADYIKLKTYFDQNLESSPRRPRSSRRRTGEDTTQIGEGLATERTENTEQKGVRLEHPIRVDQFVPPAADRSASSEVNSHQFFSVVSVVSVAEIRIFNHGDHGATRGRQDDWNGLRLG